LYSYQPALYLGKTIHNLNISLYLYSHTRFILLFSCQEIKVFDQSERQQIRIDKKRGSEVEA
jgi:hypothetical protein